MWLLFTLICGSCTAENESREALEAAGFTDITITGWAAFSCSDEDTFSTGFDATNPNNQRVSGAVCCGWLKNCTIRF